MSRQKGQGVIEFALVLPLLMLVIMGLCYFGMAFSDYLVLNNDVRSIAREASLTNCSEANLKKIKDNYKDEESKLPFHFYTVDKIEIIPNRDTYNVEVTLYYHLSEGTWLGKIMTNLTEKNSVYSENSERHTSTYFMYCDSLKNSN